MMHLFQPCFQWSLGSMKPAIVEVSTLLAIMASMGFGSYCTLKLLFSRVTVLPQV
jgi:hypothetical protein